MTILKQSPTFFSLNRYVPLALVSTIQGFNIADFITTQIALANGGIELNPYYNVWTFLFKTLIISGLMIIFYKKDLSKLKFYSSILALGFFLPVFVFTVINNLYVIGELI